MFTLNGVVINAHEVMDDMYAAVDRIVDKLEVRLKRFREKVKRYRETKPKFPAGALEEEAAKIFVTKPWMPSRWTLKRQPCSLPRRAIILSFSAISSGETSALCISGKMVTTAS